MSDEKRRTITDRRRARRRRRQWARIERRLRKDGFSANTAAAAATLAQGVTSYDVKHEPD